MTHLAFFQVLCMLAMCILSCNLKIYLIFPPFDISSLSFHLKEENILLWKEFINWSSSMDITICGSTCNLAEKLICLQEGE